MFFLHQNFLFSVICTFVAALKSFEKPFPKNLGFSQPVAYSELNLQ